MKPDPKPELSKAAIEANMSYYLKLQTNALEEALEAKRNFMKEVEKWHKLDLNDNGNAVPNT